MGKLPPGNNADIFLIIDGWDQFSQEFQALPQVVRKIASAGLDMGVHVAITARHWSEVPPEIDRLLQARVELVLPDPTESKIAPDLAATLPDRAGWGLYDGMRFLTALPQVAEADDDLQSVIDKLETVLLGNVSEVVTYEEVLKSDSKRDSKLVPIGVNEEDRLPVYLDFAADSHFYAFADGESGKTNLLRQITRGITERYTTQEAVIILVGYRRTMLGFVGGDQLLGYAVSAAQPESMVKDVHGSMTRRLPGPDVTQEQLKTRSWWTGPELFVIVDDYDLVATQTSNPLKPLVEFLAQSKDVGLHLVVARRTGGGARSLADEVISRLGELRVPGMVMNGSPNEGALIEVLEPTELPPGGGTLFNLRHGTRAVRIAWTDPNTKVPEKPGNPGQLPSKRRELDSIRA